MTRTLTLVHTTPVTIAPMKALAAQLAPDARIVNVLDDSLLPDVMRAGHVTPEVEERLRTYARAAQEAGTSAIMCCCSSVGEAVERIDTELNVPFVRVDEPMAREAVRLGTRVGVIATVASTLDPTANLIERAAKEANRDVTVRRTLVHGAYEALMSGDAERHDTLVLDALRELTGQSDVVVLAQASMARLVPRLGEPKPGEAVTPILSSPESGLGRALELLK